MWQSRVEVERYSVAYFDHITAFEAWGSYMLCKLIKYS